MSREILKVERIGAVARLTMNQPERSNVIDADMAQALLAAASACDRDPQIRAVLLTGAGQRFSAGGDIQAFGARGGEAAAYLREITAVFHGAVARLARMDKPLITAVNGPAAGGGLSLAILGDIALADVASHFTFGYTGIGYSPDGGASWLLPRLIGLRRTQEFVLTNRRVGAQEAAAIGLVTRVAEPDELAQDALDTAQRLAAGPTGAFGRTRALLLASYDTSLETQLELESRSIAISSTDDGREGVEAFLEKRLARFSVSKGG